MSEELKAGYAPARFEFAEGCTLEEMREAFCKTAVYRAGDARLVWVNEGDLYPDGLFAKQYTRTPTEAEPGEAEVAGEHPLSDAHIERFWPGADKADIRRQWDALAALSSTTPVSEPHEFQAGLRASYPPVSVAVDDDALVESLIARDDDDTLAAAALIQSLQASVRVLRQWREGGTIFDALCNVRRANAADFSGGLTARESEVYDKAVLACFAAVEAALSDQQGGV